MIGRSAGLRGGYEDRNRFPRTGFIHRLDETRNLGRHGRRWLRGLGHHGLALKITRGPKIITARNGSECVALEVDTENGDAGTCCSHDFSQSRSSQVAPGIIPLFSPKVGVLFLLLVF